MKPFWLQENEVSSREEVVIEDVLVENRNGYMLIYWQPQNKTAVLTIVDCKELMSFAEKVERILKTNKKLYMLTALWGLNWERKGSELIFSRNGYYFAKLEVLPIGSCNFAILAFHPMEDEETIRWLALVIQKLHSKMYKPNKHNFVAISFPTTIK